MNLSDAMVKKILIGVAAFIVLVFIVVKIWRRSFYSYPNTKETNSSFAITSLVQTTTTPPVITVTASGHNFAANDLIFLKSTGLTGITLPSGATAPMPTINLAAISDTTSILVTVATVGSGTFTIAGTLAGTFSTANTPKAEALGYGVMNTLTTALVSCQDTYGRAIVNAGTDTTKQQDAATARTNCIKDAVSPYTRGHCMWLPQAGSSTIPVPTSGPARTAYDNYQNDIKNIQLAYVSAANRAAAGTFAGVSDTTKAGALVSAARSADITGATRKYLATVCPGFYQPGNPASADPATGTNGYLAWSVSTTVPAAGVPAFYAPVVNSNATIADADILKWAQYAGSVTFVDGTGLSSAGGIITTGTAAGQLGVASITTGGTTYTDKSTQGGTGTEYWRTAYVTGPGTYPKPSWWT